jgi:hypothetical protein
MNIMNIYIMNMNIMNMNIMNMNVMSMNKQRREASWLYPFKIMFSEFLHAFDVTNIMPECW